MAEELIQLVNFKLGSEEFGVDILKVQEINRMVEITPVPKSPDFIEGIINLRGKVIPIVDLRKKFDLEQKEHSKNTRIIVIELEDAKTMGFIVDSVSEIIRIASDTVEPPPPGISGIDSNYIQGVGKINKRLLILLDIEKILSPTELKELSTIN